MSRDVSWQRCWNGDSEECRDPRRAVSLPLVSYPFNLPGEIYGSPMPFGLYDPDGKLLDDYSNAGITAVALLAELEECRGKTGRDLLSIYQEQRFTVFSLPIVNYGVPAGNRLPQLLVQVHTHALQGNNIAIHCSAGLGRTALIEALLAKKVLGLSGTEAIQWLERHQPSALLTPAQIIMVMECEP